jgi:hypothetical protein
LYDRILSVFDQLTTAVIVKDRIVLVHGGLPTDPTSNPGALLSQSTKNKQILEQILWNDPKELPNGTPFEKSRRSYGFHFGQSITDLWLGALNSKVLVRGHEPCQGYEIHHGGRVLTLFSCQESYPNYRAAFLLMSNSDLRALENASDLVPKIHFLE